MKIGLKRLCIQAGVCGLILAAHTQAFGGRNPLVYPKDFRLECAERGDPAMLARRALVAGVAARSTSADRSESVKQFGDMLMSLYGLKRPLAGVPAGAGRDALERAAFTALNGYVISAQMAQGVMAQSKVVPPDITAATGNMIYTLIEPYEESATLQRFWDRSQEVDRQLLGVAEARRTYAAWLLRGIIYADPIAIESGQAGYCASGPTSKENALIEHLARGDASWAARSR
jgi:hypothetical protein